MPLILRTHPNIGYGIAHPVLAIDRRRVPRRPANSRRHAVILFQHSCDLRGPIQTRCEYLLACCCGLFVHNSPLFVSRAFSSPIGRARRCPPASPLPFIAAQIFLLVPLGIPLVDAVEKRGKPPPCWFAPSMPLWMAMNRTRFPADGASA